jgi:transposase
MSSALKKTVHASEQQRSHVTSARQLWKSERQQQLDPKRLVFLDETGAATNMARQRGRCQCGARLIGRVPHGHWNTTTLVAGLRVNGVTAPFVIDRAMNGRIFRTYIERCLVPTLAPGDVVIMYNLRAHKVAGVRQAIEAVGATLLYLPPYSPDLNPIEQFFGIAALPASCFSRSASPCRPISRNSHPEPAAGRSTPGRTRSARNALDAIRC